MNGFGVLVAETLRDAARRRGLIAAALASAAAALLVQRCGSCDAAIQVQGESLSLQGTQLGAIGALVSFGLVAVWTYGIVALLASDGLATALDDGSAEAILARPVSRDVFVSARLAGVWAGGLAIGLVLLALVSGLAVTRQGVSPLPVVTAMASVAVAAFGVAALAMLASLLLPRVATLLLLTAVGLTVTGIEVAAALGAATTGWVGAVAHWGPAWVAAPLDALAPWLSAGALPGPAVWPFARGVAWTGLLWGTLLWRFRRSELLR